MSEIRLGFALCGSFCTFAPVLEVMEECRRLGYDILPIMTPAACSTDTRFGKAADFVARIEAICGRPIIRDLPGAEPIGPKKMTDILLVAPCTGNTIAKLANSITDNAVTLAVKSHLRNRNPVVVAVSTNDGLAASGENIARLLQRKHYFFVPFGQDDPVQKPQSLKADFRLLPEALEQALQGRQLQPLLRQFN